MFKNARILTERFGNALVCRPHFVTFGIAFYILCSAPSQLSYTWRDPYLRDLRSYHHHRRAHVNELHLNLSPLLDAWDNALT